MFSSEGRTKMLPRGELILKPALQLLVLLNQLVMQCNAMLHGKYVCASSPSRKFSTQMEHWDVALVWWKLM
jgi:hypothetical protein